MSKIGSLSDSYQYGNQDLLTNVGTLTGQRIHWSINLCHMIHICNVTTTMCTAWLPT